MAWSSVWTRSGGKPDAGLSATHDDRHRLRRRLRGRLRPRDRGERENHATRHRRPPRASRAAPRGACERALHLGVPEGTVRCGVHRAQVRFDRANDSATARDRHRPSAGPGAAGRSRGTDRSESAAGEGCAMSSRALRFALGVEVATMDRTRGVEQARQDLRLLLLQVVAHLALPDRLLGLLHLLLRLVQPAEQALLGAPRRGAPLRAARGYAAVRPRAGASRRARPAPATSASTACAPSRATGDSVASGVRRSRPASATASCRPCRRPASCTWRPRSRAAP